MTFHVFNITDYKNEHLNIHQRDLSTAYFIKLKEGVMFDQGVLASGALASFFKIVVELF